MNGKVVPIEAARSRAAAGDVPPPPPPQDSMPEGVTAEGFVLTPDGLRHEPRMDAKGGWRSGARVAGSIVPTRELRDTRGTGQAIETRHFDADGREHIVTVCRRDVFSDRGQIAGRYADAGLQVYDAKAFLRFLSTVQVDTRATGVSFPGWQYCSDQAQTLVFDGLNAGDAEAVFHGKGLSLRTGGSAKSLRRALRPFASCSRVVFAACAGLAGPVLDIVGMRAAGFVLTGLSQKGKSTCLSVAAAMMGKPVADGTFRSGNTTLVALESSLAEANDATLILDDGQQFPKRAWPDLPYLLHDGISRRRGQKDGDARPTSLHRCVLLMSAERPPEQLAREMGATMSAGAMTRLPSIPLPPNGHGILDHVPEGLTAVQAIEQLKMAAVKNFGHPFAAFAKALQADRAKDAGNLRQDLEREIADFISTEFGSAGGQERTVAAQFAFIAAVGRLAVDYEVLPWTYDQIRTAVAACLRDSLAARGGAGDLESVRAINAVRDFISQYQYTRFIEISQDGKGLTYPERIHKPAGYRRQVGGEWQFLFNRPGLHEAIGALDRNAAITALEKGGFLTVPEHGPSKQIRVTIPGSEASSVPRFWCVKGAILGSDDAKD